LNESYHKLDKELINDLLKDDKLKFKWSSHRNIFDDNDNEIKESKDK
jgi:hypothetical protein